MTRRQQMAAFGSAAAFALFLAAAAPAQDWINPDGSSVGEPEPDKPAGEAVDKEEGTLAERGEVDDATPEDHQDVGPQTHIEPGAVIPQTAGSPIPKGHLPPPGSCRVWFPDRPPGHQPPPGPCEALQHQVPPGAALIRG